MRMLLAGILMCVLFMPMGMADDLIDAIIDVDPRSRLESGSGVTYGGIYSPDPASAAPEEALNPDETPGFSYGFGEAYKSLRSPLYQDEEDEAALQQLDDPRSTAVPTIPLGKPYEREGVSYGNRAPHR
ncbi:MAG: hypothetical protein HY596_04265 [Candidatus Omnitrophica bacterium]|nr:hypothetical protein [Candidatus Omnitrophota bacterium]